MKNARKYAGEGGATLGEYAVIVALLSLVLVVATPGISTGIKKVICEVISLRDNIITSDGVCRRTGSGLDLGGQGGIIMDPFW